MILLFLFFQPGIHIIAIFIPPIWIFLSVNVVEALFEHKDPLIFAIVGLIFFLYLASGIWHLNCKPVGFLSLPCV